MKRIILAALVGVLVSGPVWGETTKTVCPFHNVLNSQNSGKVKEQLKRCQPGSIISILVKDEDYPASFTAARLCRFDREIVVSPHKQGLTALSCIFAGPRYPDFWKIK